MAYIVKIFAGLPTYDGTRWNGGAQADLRQCGIDSMEAASSLLANAFNACWVEALNRRKYGVTHFLLLHADIVPLDTFWPLKLHQEMERVKAKVLSVMIPIKSDTGLTSIAIESEDFWRPKRLTLTEISKKEVTWTQPNLLINTGMLLVDLREAWVEKITFTINDKIREIDGKFVAEVEPEDWNFSRQCREMDIDVWATSSIRTLHMGRKAYPNYEIWGATSDPTWQ